MRLSLTAISCSGATAATSVSTSSATAATSISTAITSIATVASSIAIAVFAGVTVVVFGVSRVALLTPLSAALSFRLLRVRRAAVPVNPMVEGFAARLALLRKRGINALRLASRVLCTLLELFKAEVKSAFKALVTLRVEVLSNEDSEDVLDVIHIQRLSFGFSEHDGFSDARKNTLGKVWLVAAFLALLVLLVLFVFLALEALRQHIDSRVRGIRLAVEGVRVKVIIYFGDFLALARIF